MAQKEEHTGPLPQASAHLAPSCSYPTSSPRGGTPPSLRVAARRRSSELLPVF